MLHARVRRNHLFEDGFQQLQPHGSKLKQRLSITFVSDLGYDEPGIDGGGLWLLRLPPRGRSPPFLTEKNRGRTPFFFSAGVMKEFMNGSVDFIIVAPRTCYDGRATC